jgi:hypothetical protein
MDYQFWINCAILVVTVFAIVYGPIKAVRITREEDIQREKAARKYSILENLMRTRQARIDPLHVSALNLIELEFYGHEKVITAYRAYTKHLNAHFPSENEALDRHLAEGDDLFSDLLFQVASSLGFVFDKRDLSRLGYLPVGLSRYHDNSHANAHLLREVLEGKRSIPIFNLVSDPKMFPPAPARKQIEKLDEK